MASIVPSAKDKNGKCIKDKHGKEVWRIFLSDGKDGDGKRARPSKTFHGTYKEAELEKSRLNLAPKVQKVHGNVLTFNEFLDMLLEERQSEYAYGTHQSYRIFRKYIGLVLGKMKLTAIEPVHIAKWITALVRLCGKQKGQPLAQSTKRQYYGMMHGIFEYAFFTNRIPANPVNKVRPPSAGENKATALSENQLMQVYLALENEPFVYKSLFTIALTSGMRRGELLGLRWQDVDIVSGKTIVRYAVTLSDCGQICGKTKTEAAIRPIHLSSDALQTLADWRELSNHTAPDDYIFTLTSTVPITPRTGKRGRQWRSENKQGVTAGGMSIGTVSQYWKRFLKRNNIPHMKFHGTRHTALSTLLTEGMPIAEVARIAGHTSPATTMRSYAHVMNDAAEHGKMVMDVAVARLHAKAQAQREQAQSGHDYIA